MKLIVGLGNDGEKYAKTRHNYGFIVIDALAKHLNLEISRDKFHGVYCKTNDFIIAKPKTYMNLSGEFVRDIANFYNIADDNILIVHDDLDLSFGSATLKIKSGDGNHNGIKNIFKELKTKTVNRLRLGIGRSEKMETRNWVLSKFTERELKKITKLTPQFINAILCFIYNDIYFAMNQYNNILKIKNEQ